jgi:hypothetical protein
MRFSHPRKDRRPGRDRRTIFQDFLFVCLLVILVGLCVLSALLRYLLKAVGLR